MAQDSQRYKSPYARWVNGPKDDPEVFPIGVWLQNPARAGEYKAAGINFYLGLWRGPTEEQLRELARHGMPVIAAQNAVGLAHRDEATLIGWLQQDEPDNAQPKEGGGWGPPVPPAEIVARYERMKAADPTRPVLLNLGQGVANDDWVGRGPDASLDDYPQYCRGADIISFDVYPVAGIDRDDGADYLWYVAKGLDRLRRWCGEEKIIWNILETTNISSPHQVTPHQLRAEVWMSIVHGSRGIVYFVHRFQPQFDEARLLHDPEMLAAVTAVNREVQSLAPVILAGEAVDGVQVTSTDPGVPVDFAAKERGGTLYLFTVGMRNAPTTAEMILPPAYRRATVEVLGEGRRFVIDEGRFRDGYVPYDVHLYRIEAR